MRKRIALLAVVAAAAVAYTAYKKAKVQKVAEHDRKNPLIVPPLVKDSPIPNTLDETPLPEETKESELLVEAPEEPVETEVVKVEPVSPVVERLSSPVPESVDSDPFGLDTFIHEAPLPAQVEAETPPQPEEILPEISLEDLIAQPEPEVVVTQPEPIIQEVVQPEIPEPIIQEVVQPQIPEPVKPEVPETSTLTNTLLESYRIQCKVMMDGYPSNKKIDLIHHIEFKDPANRHNFVNSLKIEYHEIEDSPEGLSATIRQTISTDARVAYAEIVKLAEACESFHGLYQGWVLVDCR